MSYRYKTLLLLITLLPVIVGAETLSAIPIRAISGDQIVVKSDRHGLLEIQLTGIKSPAVHTNWGNAARRHLWLLIAGRSLSIDLIRTSRGALGGTLFLGGSDINIRMIEAGLAWRTPKGQSPDAAIGYAAAMQSARRSRMGLWRDQE